MSNILDQYGIKEVADVTFFELENGKPNFDKPVLFLDTLKVSTIEQTAENTSARGGKGNPELVSWDFNKEITVSLEDALFSAKSMAFMFGTSDIGQADSLTRAVRKDEVVYKDSKWYFKDNQGKDREVTKITFCVVDGAEETIVSDATEVPENAKYAIITFSPDKSYEIKISSDKFPGEYYVVGDTFARGVGQTNDEFFQFVIPRAKVQSEVTLTLEAEGDPSTFSMDLRVLRPDDKVMMKLIKYSFDD